MQLLYFFKQLRKKKPIKYTNLFKNLATFDMSFFTLFKSKSLLENVFPIKDVCILISRTRNNFKNSETELFN